MSNSLPFEFGAPTSVPHVLEVLYGARLVKLTRYSQETGDDAVKNMDYRMCPITSRDVFAYTAGPLLMELDSGIRVVGGSDDTDWGSVILRFDRDVKGNETPKYSLVEDSDYHPIDACDKVYSDLGACSLVGLRILSIVVLQGRKLITRPQWPCEVAMRLIMDNDNELVLCHGLRDGGSDEFSVRTKSRIPAGYFEGLKEVYRR